MLHLNTTTAEPDFSDCDPEEEALLLAEVEATLVDCPRAAIQAAVVTGRHIYKRDFRQEARKLLYRFGLLSASPAPMTILR
jgi:hypothetical protein